MLVMVSARQPSDGKYIQSPRSNDTARRSPESTRTPAPRGR
ncbi:Protein of unknown function [Propionibacterium freudenreichii]|nr:Protein of unknown function [Propionibacterium freudenreichii]CEI46104.1 Protein of unknown function [Propionibacterium freudenreichii]